MGVQEGQVLRKLRKDHKLTQKQLAELLAITVTPLSRWENGEREISLHVIRQLAAIFQLEVPELLNMMEEGVPLEGPAAYLAEQTNVIVVEPVEKEREDVVAMLRAFSPKARTEGFATIEAALDFAWNAPVALVFLAIRLGEENGLELANEFKKINPLTNILILTDHPEYAVRAWELHPKGIVNGFIVKPLTERRLARELKNLDHPVPKLLQ